MVTVGQGPDRTGFTATSVESLSAEPPRLLVSVSENSSSWKELQKYPSFGTNILRADHQGLADQFAGRGGLHGIERYRGANWTNLSTDGAAILDDAPANRPAAISPVRVRRILMSENLSAQTTKRAFATETSEMLSRTKR